MIRYIHFILFIIISISPFSVNAQHARTEVKGLVLTFDRDGNRMGYPFELDAVESALTAQYWPMGSTGNIKWTFPSISEERIDNHSTAMYEIDINDEHVHVLINFEYGRYIGSEELDINLHVGMMPVNIKVYETASSDARRYESIKSLVNNNRTNMDELNRSIDGLLALFAANPRPVYLVDLHVVVRRILRITGFLSTEQATKIQSLPYREGFDELSPDDRFRIYSELGYVIFEYSNLKDIIESSLSHAQLGQEMLAKAIDIYENDIGHSIPSGRIADAYQVKYNLECSVQLHRDCFDTIAAFIRRYKRMNQPTYLAFLNDYTLNLSNRTLGESWESGFNSEASEKISGNYLYREFWSQFYCSSASNGVVMSHISETPHLEDFLDFSKGLMDQSGKLCPSEMS